MLTPEELDRIAIVLVRARNPNNIGAAARAMHNFGLRHLHVVNDYPVPFESARSAVDASAVLADAVAYATLAEAIADCNLVVGTTAVGERDLQHPLLPLTEAAPRILAELSRGTGPNSSPGRVALLFGSEKTGLSNEEMSHCNWLLTVPMQQYEGLRHASMNLGQAVAVCLYELVRDLAAAIPPGESSPVAAPPPKLKDPQPPPHWIASPPCSPRPSKDRVTPAAIPPTATPCNSVAWSVECLWTRATPPSGWASSVNSSSSSAAWTSAKSECLLRVVLEYLFCKIVFHLGLVAQHLEEGVFQQLRPPIV